jgi:hypothetical protein
MDHVSRYARYEGMMFPRKSGHKDKRIVYNTTIGGI